MQFYWHLNRFNKFPHHLAGLWIGLQAQAGCHSARQVWAEPLPQLFGQEGHEGGEEGEGNTHRV